MREDATSKPFAKRIEVFSNSSSVTVLVDRLLHRAEIEKIEAIPRPFGSAAASA